MEMNEQLKKECMGICEEYKIDINFNDENWKNQFIKKIDWWTLSKYLNLSEDFIEYFQNELNWANISQYQYLSENFIEKFINRVNWYNISLKQNLSEFFIDKFQDRITWYNIYYNQNISKELIKKYKHKISEYFWDLKPNEEKENDIKEAGYEILEDENGKYILAYKVIREDNRSFANPKDYEYIIGKIYESNCDCNIMYQDSYGLAAWDKKNAINFGRYREFKLILVKIYINDIGAIIKNNNSKIRCFKFQVVEEVKI